jgi:hypothetical protein
VLKARLAEAWGSLRHDPALNPASGAPDVLQPSRPVSRPRPCAWPARLERLLTLLFAPAAVRVTNLARNGYNTRVWAMENVETIRELRSADLIVHSGAIGDAEFAEASVRAASLSFFAALLDMPNQPAVVSLEVTRAADLRRSGTLRWLRPCRPQEELQGLLNTSMRFCSRWWEVPSHRAPVLEALRVPAITFRDAVWPVRGMPGVDGAPGDVAAVRGFRSQAEYDNASYTGSFNVPHRAVHFPPQMHERVACVAAYAFARAAVLLSTELAADRPAPLPEQPPNASALPQLLSVGAAEGGEGGALLRCEMPLSKLLPPLASFAAQLPGRTRESRAAQRPASGKWWYGEDVAGNGKPGWIADTPGAAVAFGVSLGSDQRVILSRLRSYTPTWAPVRVSLWHIPAAAAAADTDTDGDAGAGTAAGTTVLAMARAWRRAFFECVGGKKKDHLCRPGENRRSEECALCHELQANVSRPIDTWTVHSRWDQLVSVPDHDVHTVLDSGSTSGSLARGPTGAGGRPEVRPRKEGESIRGAHQLHLELLHSDLRGGPKQVGCPWGKCSLSGPQAGKFKLLSVTSC